MNLKVGENAKIIATILPTTHTETNITYTSSDEEVVTVDNQGNVLAIAEGLATITVEATNGVKATCEVTIREVGDLLLGDLNFDGVINYNDAVVILQSDSRLITLTDEQKEAGDVNGDGIINYNDAVQILRKDAGLIEEF